MRLSAFLFSAILLSGCAAHQWTQEGKGYLETEQEYWACVNTAVTRGQAIDSTRVATCMGRHGYHAAGRGADQGSDSARAGAGDNRGS